MLNTLVGLGKFMPEASCIMLCPQFLEMQLLWSCIMLTLHYWTSSVKNLWKLCEKFLAYYFPKAMKNGKPMKYLWKGAKYNQWSYHERPMKLMAWTRSMKKLWNLFPSNETYEKAVKIIAVQPALLKSHENCYPQTTYEKPWKCSHLKEPWKY